MQDKSSKKRIILTIILVTLVIGILLCVCIRNGRTPYKDTLLWNEGWTLQINDDIQHPPKLNLLTFDSVNCHDKVIIENIIPDMSLEAPMLRLWMCHSAIKVWVGDSVVYTFGEEQYDQSRVIGSGYHWIALPKGSAGEKLHIEFYPNENDAFTNITTIYLGESQDAYPDFISDTFLSICAGTFLIMFGLVTILISLIMLFASTRFSSLMYTGFFSLAIGLWTICNRGDIQLVSSNLIFNQYLEYYSFYAGSLPILLYMKSIRKEKEDLNITNIFIGVNLFLIVLTIILNAAGMVRFPSMVRVFHVFDFVLALYVMISCAKKMKQGRTEEKLVLIGISVLAISFLYDILIFNIAKYYDGVFSRVMGLSAVGSIVLILCMLFGYAHYVYRGIYSHIEQETLLRMAYTDNLTKLANRAKFNEVIKSYEMSKQPFSIIMFDLNNLKVANDIHGHSSGDRLLHKFAKVLQLCFGNHGTVARIGGDEFAVLLPETNQEKLNDYMKQYESLIEKENLEDTQSNHSVVLEAAWGFASNTENNGMSIEETKKLADVRMYDKKRQMKENVR